MEKTYPSLEQRMLACRMEVMPPFYPSKYADVQGQRQFYALLRSLYEILMENPELLFASIHEDDFARHRFNRALDATPGLRERMQSIRKKLDTFWRALMQIGSEGEIEGNCFLLPKEIRISKSVCAVLEAAGIRCQRTGGQMRVQCAGGSQMPFVWRWMAQRDGADVCSFSQARFCLSEEGHCYALEMLTLLQKEDLVRQLDTYFLTRGYARIEYRGTENLLFSLDYAKNYPLKPKEIDAPLKDAWAERSHAGISVRYDDYMGHPLCFCMRMPHMEAVLRDFEKIPQDVQAFILRWNKKCDGCRYCVQTDKTKTRPIRAIEAQAERLCPIFPGFYYVWEEMDETRLQEILSYFNFIETYFGGRIVQ